MPRTAHTELDRAVAGQVHPLEVGDYGGLFCPVCLDWIAEPEGGIQPCAHLLYEWLDLSTQPWHRRSWIPLESVRSVAPDSWLWDASRAIGPSESWVRTATWTLVRTLQTDEAGSGWTAWFAVPVSWFFRAADPSEVVRVRFERIRKGIAEEESIDEPGVSDPDRATTVFSDRRRE